MSVADGQGTGTIVNDDALTISLTATDADAEENTPDTGTWRVSRNGTSGAVAVNLEIAATSTATSADWTQTGATFTSSDPGGVGTVTIPNGQSFVDIVLTPIDDAVAEFNETVLLTVGASGGYTVATIPEVDRTVTIARNDTGVSNTNDSGEGSLRLAVENANLFPGNDTIAFLAPLFTDAIPETIVLSGGELPLSDAVAIAGPGADLLTISGNNTSRIFHIADFAGSVALADLTLRDGFAPGIVADGGAILKSGTLSSLTLDRIHLDSSEADNRGGGLHIEGGTVTLRDSTVSGNVANGATTGGGGISNFGDLTLVNTTVSGNRASMASLEGGGGILNSGTLTLHHSTITANRASGTAGGGGLHSSGSETLRNSLLIGNFQGSGATPSDIEGANVGTAHFTLVGDAATSGGITDGMQGNLVGVAGSGTLDPATVLDPVLVLRGGPVPIHALVAGGAAVDAGDPAFDGSVFTPVLDFDQRGNGFARLNKGLAKSATSLVDLGAFELFSPPLFTNADLRVGAEGGPINLARATGATPPGGTFSGPGVAGGLFDPSVVALGTHTLTYTVTDAFGVANYATFTVTVIGSPAKLSIRPPRRFPTTEIGRKSRPQRIVVTNVGGLPATGLRLVVKGPGRGDFKVLRPTVASLEARAATRFTATFRPRKPGLRRAVVTLLSNAPPASAVLTGKATTRAGGGLRPPRAPSQVVRRQRK